MHRTAGSRAPKSDLAALCTAALLVPTQPAAQGWATSSAKASVCVWSSSWHWSSRQPGIGRGQRVGHALAPPPPCGPIHSFIHSGCGSEEVQGTVILGLSWKPCVTERLTADTPPAYTQCNSHHCPNQSKAPENKEQWIKNCPLLRTWKKKIPQYTLVLKHPKTDYKKANHSYYI